MLQRWSWTLLLAASVSCGSGGESGASGSISLPDGFPSPAIPVGNRPTPAKIDLGRHLFYDKRLSANNTQSCSSCHEQARAFAGSARVSIGSTGEAHPRNANALTNVAYNSTLTWANPNLLELERQIAIPLFGAFPIELGASGHEEEILNRLRTDEQYRALFAAAFPEDSEPVTFERAIQALATFVRSLISGDSPYDRFVAGKGPLSESAKRGMNLFFSERLECHHCHGGFNFSASTTHDASGIIERPFHNTGLYNIDGAGSYPADNTGLIAFTRESTDMGRFRAPSLRNVEVTAPYMHDGSVATLEGVVRFYEAGGRNIVAGPHRGDGRKNPFKSGLVSGFTLSDEERSDLLEFLKSLTDQSFLTNPALSDPAETK